MSGGGTGSDEIRLPEAPLEVVSPELPARPKVSVSMITYNHAAYIEQAVRSAVEQEVDFPMEVVVGDDCSTDGTREILLRLQRERPDRVRLLLHRRNLGAAGMFNGVAVRAACRGEYVAKLEGDDFWCSRRKLAAQAAVLDADPALSACFHDAWFLDASTGSVNRYTPPRPGERYSYEDILRFNAPTTCTLMFRSACHPGVPAWFSEVFAGDWPSNLLISRAGPMLHLREPMSVYRVHGGGVWSRLSSVEKLERELGSYEVVLRQVDPKDRALVRAALLERVFWVAKAAAEAGHRRKSLAYLTRFVGGLPGNRFVRMSEVARVAARAVLPTPVLRALRGGRAGA